MAKIKRLQDVEVDDAELVKQLRKFHRKNRQTGPVKTREGEELHGKEAVLLTEQTYNAHNLAFGAPVYVHEVNPGARILWVAAFNQDGKPLMLFMSPESIQKIHTPAGEDEDSNSEE